MRTPSTMMSANPTGRRLRRETYFHSRAGWRAVPYSDLPKDKQDALEALERLTLRHKVVAEDQAQAIARLITEDPSFQFPPPQPPEEAAPTEAGGEAAEASSADEAEPAPSPS